MEVYGFERSKKYQAIAEFAIFLKIKPSVDDLTRTVFETISRALRQPSMVMIKVTIGDASISTPEFYETPQKIEKTFTTSENQTGNILIYCSHNHCSEDGSFFKECRSFLDTISKLISSSITIEDFENLLLENVERNKELSGLEKVNQILRKNEPYDLLLQEISEILPSSWKYPNSAGARIKYGTRIFLTDNFQETPWIQMQLFEVPGGMDGSIEICYNKEFPEEDEGPFLKEERSFINNIAHLLSVALGCKIHDQVIFQRRERIKELSAINQTTAIIMQGKPKDDTLQNICNILPQSWQFPEYAAAKITFEDKVYVSREFVETPSVQREQFITIDNQIGTVEIYYINGLPQISADPFLAEEQDLICNIARLIAHYLNNEIGRRLLNNLESKLPLKDQKNKIENSQNKVSYMIRSVLVISSPQDACFLASEFEDLKQIPDPYYYGDIWHVPNFSFYPSLEQAELELDKNNYDIIFVIATSADQDLRNILTVLKSRFPEIQLNFITKSSQQVIDLQKVLQKNGHYKTSIFTYNDNPNLLLYLCKLNEDFLNCDQFVAPTILLIEDSPDYYTTTILSLYNSIFGRLEKHSSIAAITNKTRVRILLACNYEDAVQTASMHSRSLIGVLSDVEFQKSGTINSAAGFELYTVINKYTSDIKYLLHSTDLSNAEQARISGMDFLHKRLPSFNNRLNEYLEKMNYFFYKPGADHNELAFDNINTFLDYTTSLLPEELIELTYDTHFLNWLKVQGLFKCAEQIVVLKKSSLDTSELHEQISTILNHVNKLEHKPTIVKFNPSIKFNEKSIFTVSNGSLGGKGKNIAFLHSLISNKAIFNTDSVIKIRTPVTLIIKSGEYDRLLENPVIMNAISGNDFKCIQDAFDSTDLSNDVLSALRAFVQQIDKPLAVRSSSLFEDSVAQPFAGTFETYIIPNNHPDPEIRLLQLVKAIKRVYLSPFKPDAQAYFAFLGKSATEDRMSIVLQSLVGNRYDCYYYPQISGVAGSYNFYPVGHMKPEDGFAIIALGLGVYVVEGRSGHRFSPVYPHIDFGSTDNLISGSQIQFYAVDMNRSVLDFDEMGEKAGLSLLDVSISEEHGTLNHCASVYDYENDRFNSDLRTAGPRVVDFADILKYGYLPLADMLNDILQKLSSLTGSPVEIEFAIDTCRKQNICPSLYLLQVRPLSGEKLGYSIRKNSISSDKCLLYSQTSLGNGRISNLTDVVMINIDAFDKYKTEEMVKEVDFFNRLQVSNDRSYIIIGPGRWGTRDKSLGIPVTWSQICNAKIIVETGMNCFPLDASLGSHFFHNITVMKVGYIAVSNSKKDEFINWNAFKENMKCVQKLRYFSLLRAEHPLIVELDGRNKQALITRI